MTSVFELLDREWDEMRCDRGAAIRLREVCEIAGGAASLDALERFVRDSPPAIADRVLLALVTRAVAGDSLAARVLLQLVLPGARNLARRWWAVGDWEERAAATVTAVYDRICRYPLDRRPGRVAANVLMDASRELRRAIPSAVVTPVADPARLMDTSSPLPQHPALELTEVLYDAVQDGVLGSEAAELIARSRIAGDLVEDIARQSGLRPRTIWDRRHRAEEALKRWAASHRALVATTQLRNRTIPA